MEIPEAAIKAARAHDENEYRRRAVIRAALPALREEWERELLDDSAIRRIAEWLFGDEGGEHMESIRTALHSRLKHMGSPDAQN